MSIEEDIMNSDGLTTSLAETNENKSFLGEPPSKFFEAKFIAKGQKARDRQIIENLHAAHLREEFKRALSQGVHYTTE